MNQNSKYIIYINFIFFLSVEIFYFKLCSLWLFSSRLFSVLSSWAVLSRTKENTLSYLFVKIPFKMNFGQIISHGKNCTFDFYINLCCITLFD